jgi:hypothetical protein
MTIFATLHDKAHVDIERNTIEYYLMRAQSLIGGGIYDGMEGRLMWMPHLSLQPSA